MVLFGLFVLGVFENTYSFVSSQQGKQTNLNPSNSIPFPPPSNSLMLPPESCIMDIQSETTEVQGLSGCRPFYPLKPGPTFKPDALHGQGWGLWFESDQ